MNNSDYETTLKSLRSIILGLSSKEEFVGTKTEGSYEFKTYSEGFSEVLKLANFFQEGDLYSRYQHEGKEHNLIGIFTKPRAEALLTTLALNLSSSTVLTIYDTIEEHLILKILEHSGLNTLVVDSYCLTKLLKVLKDSGLGIKLRNLVLIDQTDEDVSGNSFNFKYYFYENILRDYCDKYDDKKCSTKEDDNIVILSYTNELKGVLFKESAILKNLRLLLENKYISQLPENYTYYSMISLAEIPEYLNCLVTIILKGRIGFMLDHVSIFDDLKILKPHFLYSFPKVLVKVYESFQTIISKLDHAKRLMFDNAIKVKIDSCSEEGTLNHHIWDKLLFDKIKNSMGGNIALIFIGGGHLAHHYLEFLKACLSCFLIEFYGNTETLGFIAQGNEFCNQYIGDMFGDTKYKISKCNKIGYYPINTEDEIYGYGEFCVQGTSLSCGYLNEESLLDKDGWLHTGDYVIHLTSGIKYIDKINSFLFTKEGSVVSPYQLEQHYIACDKITHISVVQDDYSNLVAIVRLKKVEQLMPRSRKGSVSSNGSGKKVDIRRKTFPKQKIPECLLDNTNDVTLSDEPDIETLKDEIVGSFKTIWNENKLKSYELISKVYIIDNETIYKQSHKLLTKRLNFDKAYLKEIVFKNYN
jgi:long-chain acyl-CoA synthetase